MAVVVIGDPITVTLKAAIEYIVNPTKTNGGIMTSSNCGIPSIAESVHRGFERTMEAAENDRTVGRPGVVLAHHVIQAFKPGEITPNKAHDLGVEFIEKILGGNDEYDYVIATHVDRDHIHNHIIFNPINRKTLRRYRMPPTNVYKYRKVSNEITRREGLSVTHEFGEGFKSFDSKALGDIYARARGRSNKAKLEALIDEACRNTFSWESFTESMKEIGVEVSFKGQSVLFYAPDILRHKIRGKTLGPAYTETALMARLGRQSLVEFVVQPFLVKKMHTDQYRVRLPGSRPPAYITVDSHHLNNHGTHWRMYLPETMQTWTTDVYGQIQKEVKTPELFNYFNRTDPLSQATIKPHQANRLQRGKSAAQQRYFASVDRRVDQLHKQTQWVNLLTQYAQADDPSEFLRDLRSHTEDLVRELNTAIIERQRGHDLGSNTSDLDQRIDSLGQEIRTFKAFYNEQTQTPDQSKGHQR
ncbi:relaxase/mobilization nuclease domain-containing protein [Arcanobacterium bovis]|uniref:MobA/VirD2-like nuclease domain-containing protein n=1 Tax=Arcanobacterium bovis TaxID=2529275 RepID=A0A4Q9UYM7_9ACTO|nr:relaxase/mobilization nuclease domain-containing protein [Arcanobacterium bovis]TBW20769.1 hypothetical protein EZJ44_08270 [Arcanobacterium bovis]